jgi:hypothetical protein
MKTNLERSLGEEIACLDEEQQRPRGNSSSLAQQKESRKVGVEPVLTCSNSVAEDEAERRPNTLMQIIDDVVG